jgi:hypothetical protein
MHVTLYGVGIRKAAKVGGFVRTKGFESSGETGGTEEDWIWS